MIAHVRGIVAEKFAGSIIVDVAGIGYEVAVPVVDYEQLTLHDETKLYTYHHVREQSEELFGFSTLAAKKLFELLITVQGIGPKAALAILSLGNIEQVRNAIANSDVTYVTGANGVDLADKVGLPTEYYATGTATQAVSQTDEALEALMALGYTLADASKALESVDSSLPTAARITEALKQ